MSGADADVALRREQDAASRRAAQSLFDEPLVLEAGAGTGKTAVLVARVLVWCLGPGWERTQARLAGEATGLERTAARLAATPERIAAETLRRVVAITFTEAAAAEMATRLGEGLVALRQGREVVGLSPELLPEAAVCRERAGALLDALDQLAVRTIHAWCRRLLAENALEAGLHPRFEIDADERLQAEVVREVTERWLVRACAEGDPDLLALAGREKPFGPADVEAALLALVKEAAPPDALDDDPCSDARVSAFCAALEAQLAAFCAAEGERLVAVSGPRTQATAGAAHHSLAALRRHVAGPGADVERLVAELQELWEEKNVERLQEWARGDFGKTEEAAVGAEAGALAREAGSLLPAVEHLVRLDLPLLAAARRVLRPLLGEACRLLRERGVESYAALLRDTRDLLRRSPDAAARIRREIDQLLVDEFQDTDLLQCEILRLLVLDAPAGERPCLFLVGDPKQSIYGWRNADLRAYDAFVREVERLSGRERQRLTVNFRSVPAILEEVTRVIEPVMQARPGLQPPFERLVPCERLAAESGFGEGPRAPVEHWVAWDWDGDAKQPVPAPRAARAVAIEARALARDLVALRAAGVPLGEVGILLRALSDVETYLEALRDFGVPYVVGRDKTFYARREIADATALVRCLLDPHDHLALVTVLRSPLVGVPDAALLPLWRAKLPELATKLRGEHGLEEVRAAALAAAREVPADVPGLERVAGWERALDAFLGALAELRRRFDTQPADRFVESVRLLLCPEAAEAARYLGRYRVANLERFLRELAAALEESGGDAWTVLGHLRRAPERREVTEGRPRDAAEGAVQVMTIHGAKGLDFEHVYLMQCHKQPGGEQGPRASLAERPAAGQGAPRFEYELLGAPTLGFHEVARDAATAEENERVRLLYVALTRAKRRLVVSGCWPAATSRPGTHAEILASRRGEKWDLSAHMTRLAGAGGSFVDAEHTRLRFPALDAPEAEAAAAAALRGGETTGLPDPAALRAESEHLLELHARARAREARPFGAPATSGAEDEEDPEALLSERFGDEEDGAERPRRPRRVTTSPGQRCAMAAGSLVHHVLERLPFDLEIAVARTRAEALLDAALLCAEVGDADRGPARALAREILERFFAGRLYPRWRGLAGGVVARELAVVVEPGEGGAAPSGPVGFLSGAVDLLYRDPASGEWVVADYKTDEVEDDAAALRARAGEYRRQGAAYVSALQRALGLAAPPRFELWFLRPGRVEVLGP